MRKFYFMFLLLTVGIFSAQTYKAKVSQEDASQPWVVTFTHNDWSFFDPGFDALKVYLFVETSQNTSGQNLWDNWGTFAVDMTWDATVNARRGSVNLKNYNWSGSNSSINNGNTINNFKFILVRTGSPNWTQTSDLLASDYGFAPFSISTLAVSDASVKTKSSVASGKLITSQKGDLEISILDFNGRSIKKQNVTSTGAPIDLNFYEKGIYLLKIQSGIKTETIKFLN